MDITQAQTYLPLIGGVLIPFLVALIAKQHTTGWFKAGLAFVLAGVTALGVYLADVNASHTWRGALTAFALAVGAAAGSRVTITGGADTKIAERVPGGLGPATTSNIPVQPGDVPTPQPAPVS